jgi:hypothetical protein
MSEARHGAAIARQQINLDRRGTWRNNMIGLIVAPFFSFAEASYAAWRIIEDLAWRPVSQGLV